MTINVGCLCTVKEICLTGTEDEQCSLVHEQSWISVMVCRDQCKDKTQGRSLAGIGLSLQIQPPSVGCTHSVHSQTSQHMCTESQQQPLWVMQMHHKIISPHTLISMFYQLPHKTQMRVCWSTSLIAAEKSPSCW